ncbi:MAG: YggS family pyridoxal phosphate-dependent enzyme [Tindallia sp. MSAO_Bac2]|nr:MAG: YggS family pyridoxal phosphate-dependent enzyme [Tindallia sp. MSAO_Bac2]
MNIADNLNIVENKIQEALQKSGDPDRDVHIIAVTKTISTETIRCAMKSGLTNLGENKVQELVSKYEQIGSGPNWHMIGHLQRNKVKYIVDKVSLIHSMDSLSLAEEINKKAGKVKRDIDVLVQVNVSGEESKFGVDPESALDLIESMETMQWVRIKGLMTMAPFTANQQVTRDCFKRLFELREKIWSMNFNNAEMKYLSMGMSNDYQTAVEEGSNMVRIGSAIFGNRNYD